MVVYCFQSWILLQFCVQILDELRWYTISNLHYEHHFLGFQTTNFQNIYYCLGKGACKILVQNESTNNIG